MSDQEPPSYGPPPAGPPAGWYPDPNGLQVMRWWDGRQWGTQTQPMPSAGQEPQRPDPDLRGDMVPPPGPAADPSSFPSDQPQPPDPLKLQEQGQQGQQQSYPGPVAPGRGPRKPWTDRRKAGVGVGVSAGILVLILIIVGISNANSGSVSSAAGTPSSAAGSPSAAAGSPSAAAGSPSAAASPSVDAAARKSAAARARAIHQARLGRPSQKDAPKSQTKSQRSRTQGDTRRQSATIAAGKWPVRTRPAT
jgi:Protein of unknown function (DUF2510)